MDETTLESMVDSFLADESATEAEVEETETFEEADSAVESDNEDTHEDVEESDDAEEVVNQDETDEASSHETPEMISRSEFNSAMAQQRIAQKEEKMRMRAIEAEKAKNDEIINALMTSAGYSNRDDFERAVEMAKREKIKEETGLDDKAIDHINEVNRREAEVNMRAEFIEQREMEAKAHGINNGILQMAEGVGLQAQQAYQLLDDRGITLEMLLESPSPELLVRGAMADVYAEAKAKETLQMEASRPTVNSNRLPKGEKSIDSDEYSMESILAEAMETLGNNQGGY